MPADILTETLISFPEAAKRFPAYRGSGRLATTTLWRWAMRGARAGDGSLVKLEVVRVGGRWLTSVESLARFTERLAVGRENENARTSPKTAVGRRRASEAAMARLKQRGVAIAS